MNKYFKIKYNDFKCPDCGTKLYVPDMVKMLRIQYEPNSDENGYLSLVNSKCECGNRYKIYCLCHELSDNITVVADKIRKLVSFDKEVKNG